MNAMEDDTRELELRPSQESDLPMLEQWFQDTELRERLGATLPLRRWFDFVQSEPGYFSWLALDGDTVVGEVAVEIEPDGTASEAPMVNPALRGKGYGKEMLRAMLARSELAAVTEMRACIEPNNTASIRCHTSVGFVQQSSEPDEEGLLTLVYRRAQ